MKELYDLVKQFDFVDDSRSAIITFCQNEDELEAVKKYITEKKYKTIRDILTYAFYLYMKRNHPDRIIEDE